MPQSKLASFNMHFEIDNCRLICYSTRREDGDWELHIDTYVASDCPHPQTGVCDEFKTPSPKLQELVLRYLGVETELDPNDDYPMLKGRLPCRPDPNELIGKIEAMLANVDADSLWHDREG